MIARRPRLLAVSHESSLTGAPINLAHFLGWITANTDVEVHTLVLRDGPLHLRFAEISPVTVPDWRSSRLLLDPRSPQSATPLSAVHDAALSAWTRRRFRRLEGFDLAYLNGVSSIVALPHLPRPKAVVAHVHEMGLALDELPAGPKQVLTTRPDLWVAVSSAARDDLVSIIGGQLDRVRVHHEFIDAAGLAARRDNPRENERLRRQIGIADDSVIVVGSGTLDWRKGPDLFVQLAATLARRTRAPLQFVWVGGGSADLGWGRLEAERRRAGVDDRVRFVGVQEDPARWFAMADVFALTSREDPFPLVCLESAALGVPIVTFRNGGAVELLESAGPEAAAGIVDHLDVATMADRVLALLESESLHASASRQLQQTVLARHDVRVAAPRLFAEIEGFLR